MKNTRYKHLIQTDRDSIEFLLNADSKAKHISAQLNRDPRSISKEVKRNRYFFVRSNAKNSCGLQDICNMTRLCDQCISGKCKHCSYAKCSTICPDFDNLPHCKRTKRFPYVCNGCEKLDTCSLPKFFYKADRAQKNYDYKASASKSRLKLNEVELAKIDTIVSEGVEKKHSLAVIIDTNRLPICVSTLYRYIDNNLLSVKNIDLKRKVGYKPRLSDKPKAKPFEYKYNYLEGRSFEDFSIYVMENPELNVWQMDFIEGKRGIDEPAVLSLLHTKSNLQFFFKLRNQTQHTVELFFDSIKRFFGEDLFKEIFAIILTDNGTGFRDPLAIITSRITGETLISIFYCHPRRSDEKGKCEKNHVHFRECFPKGISINLLDKKSLNYISNQVNNYPRKSLNFSSPFQTASMMLNKKAFELNNLTYINPNKVSLKRFK